jgi:protein tyrosine/serine phosphatase
MLEYIKRLFGFKHIKPYQAEVCPWIWRGSKVNQEQLKDLKKRGFRLIISLCSKNQKNAKICEKVELKYLQFTVCDNQLEPEEVNAFISIMKAIEKTKVYCPIYIYCEDGREKTGIMIACYRVKAMGWKVEDAIKEAKEYGLKDQKQIDFIKWHSDQRYRYIL